MSGSNSGVVTFDYTAWSTRYPEFAATVAQPLAQAYFNEATLYLDNTACSAVQDVNQRGLILNMLTAHIAAMNAPTVAPDGSQQPASSIVGRIASASEGSVSVSTADYGTPGTAAWFVSTKYGAAAYQALAAYRTARYVPGPRPFLRGYGGYPWR